MNAIGLALKSAGFEYETAEDRKLKLGAEAWAKHPKPNAGIARKEYVMNALGGEIAWSMITGYDKHLPGILVTILLNKTEPKRNSDTGVKSVGGGHADPDTQNDGAPATPSRDDAQPQAERRSEPATGHPTPIPAPPAAPPPFGQYLQGTVESRAREKITASEKQIMAEKHRARGLHSIKVAVRMCKLDTVMVYGRPIGDCMVADVRKWADLRMEDHRAAARDARFAMILIANLESNKVIRDHWRNPDEVDAIYAKAEAGYAA